MMPSPAEEARVGQELEREPWLADNYEITLLFGSHGDAADAEATFAHIESGSIVFVEGYMLGYDYASQKYATMLGIASDRLRDGFYQPSSALRLLRLATNFIEREKTHPSQYDEHSASCYLEALRRNCVIMPADYLNLCNDDLSRFEPYLDPEPVPLRLERTALRSAIALSRQDYKVFEAGRDFNHIREQAAAGLMLASLQYWAEVGMLEASAKDENGKTRVYLVYGTAHRDSLTQELHRRGLPAKVLIWDEASVFEEGEILYWRNMPRRVYRRSAVRYYLEQIGSYAEAEQDVALANEVAEVLDRLSNR